MHVYAQKKPLDHGVYDAWETIAERMVSNDGRYVVFAVNLQEGDGRLVLTAADNSWKLEVPRGYNAAISADSRFVVCKIKPFFKDTREARMKKKRPDDMPKDSLAIIGLGTTNGIRKISRVKAYKMPSDGGTWLAYHLEKPLPDTAKKPAPAAPKNPQLDSAKKVIDSLKALINKFPAKVQQKYLDELDELEQWVADADETPAAGGAAADAGSELVLYNLATQSTLTFKNVTDFVTDRQGNRLALETAKNPRDSLSKPRIITVQATSQKADTILTGFNDTKNLVLAEDGSQMAFVAERDSSAKAVQKFYKLWYHRAGADSARMIADRNASFVAKGWSISENANLAFSKTGKRLFFGTAPIMPPKDTTVPDFEKATLDIWHYNDDYLQTVQLKNLDRELKRSYLAMYNTQSGTFAQLADKTLQEVRATDNGDGKLFWGTDDRAYRVASQWTGRGKTDLYSVNPESGARTLVKNALDGQVYGTSPDGTTLLWYQIADKQYHTWRSGSEYVPSKGIKPVLYDEENDVPDDPNAYGPMAWLKDGSSLYVYDRYDIWKLDPEAKAAPVCITAGAGRATNITVRWQNLNREESYVENGRDYLFTLFDNKNKTAGIKWVELGKPFGGADGLQSTHAVRMGNFAKAKNAYILSYSTETYQQSPDIRVAPIADVLANPLGVASMHQPNPQQANYLWGTAELIEWKAYDGKMTQGIVYKPENFDPRKKYPMIAYFYETLSDGLYGYTPPSPTPSRLNISFFVSRGYVVLAPDIHYRKGEPGQSAYDYIVSGARYLVKQGYVDSTKMGLQGQSWGGYQIAQLITMTPLFAAAWAGAPVANMTSAYGGIRWESGLNRQFQYEKSQSRIGATLWERQDLYLKNSPLFHLPKVKTPLVIMANDADGAVPWYQGIEMFTAMRRLGKQVWMLNYNNEAHNLVERRNRKDISIREQQFFDWLLKGEAAPKWLKEGVPAVDKGRDYGL